MDVSLNYQRKNVSSKKPTNNSSRDNGFSFEFIKNNKVKAVVARRRTKIDNSVSKGDVGSNTYAFEKSKSPPQSCVLRPPDSSGDEEELVAGDDDDLSLNITKGESTTASSGKQKKLSREQRLDFKKAKQRSVDKVLTAKEIDEGIKRFSELPKRKTQRKSVKSDLFKNVPESEIVGQRLVKPITEKLFTGASISSLNLHPHCVKNLADILNITELTQVQQKTIPKALEGRDILVRSQTGSGKTLAYALPIVQKLQEIRPKLTRNSGIQAVVIVPTRELAIQTYELLLKLVKPFTWIVPGILSGGEKRKAEKARLRKGITILVGTPGRLVDHLLNTESFKLDKVKWLILDEADRLLEMGYERDVNKIVEGINNQKGGDGFKVEETSAELDTTTSKNVSCLQRLLLSATLTPAVQQLAGLTLIDPLFIDTSDEVPQKHNADGSEYDAQQILNEGNLVIPETIQLSYILVHPKLRLITLSALLAKECAKKNMKALVFMSTVEMVNYHYDLMRESLTHRVLDDEENMNESEDENDEPLLMGLKLFKLHGSLTQQERSGCFKSFREAKAGVLLATDVACRGIDVPVVNLIVQYSPPQNIPDFVHRVGRTARAGKSGQAILFLGPNEADFVRVLENKRIRISQGSIEPYLEALHTADSAAHSAQEAAANLQHKFEDLVRDDNEMHDRACKAFVSWVKFYSTFPKELKSIFNVKNANIGHYAKSFALRELPKSFMTKYTAEKPQLPVNRLTYTERNPFKIKHTYKQEKTAKKGRQFSGSKLNKYLPKSICLTTSEFDSGIPAIKKRRT